MKTNLDNRIYEGRFPLNGCKVVPVIKFLKYKRRWMFSAGVALLNDNAWPHTTVRSTHLLQEYS